MKFEYVYVITHPGTDQIDQVSPRLDDKPGPSSQTGAKNRMHWHLEIQPPVKQDLDLFL